MKVGQKVLVPPLVAIAFLLLLGAVSVVLMARQGISISTLIKNRGGSMTLALTAFQEAGQVQVSAYRTFLAASSNGEEALRTAAAKQTERLDVLAKKGSEYLAMPTLHPTERELAQAAQETLVGYRTHLAAAMAQALSDPPAAILALQASEAAFQKLAASYSALAELQTQLAADSTAQGAADFRSMVLSIIAIALFAAAASLATAIAMARRVVRPLQTATQAASEIARGDLRFDIQVQGRDETAELLRAQSQMQQELRRLVAEVVTGAGAVAQASAQIAQGNQDLSQRTEMQASTLEETASSVEELTSTVTQNAQNARQASQLAVGASEVARKGGDVVSQVVSTMSGISQSSKRIEDIIGVIDGIAFQTNILALNAAVEAARAGEQGRGFAVVASEVRNLAQRSAAAAKEIKGLIGASVEQVATGTRLVDTAGETMKEIVNSVRKVSDLIAEIAAASQEQSSGIEQVSTAIAQMDQFVQQNASLVEEATAAAEAMRSRASGLLHAVSWFQLDAATPAPAPQLAQPLPGLPAIGFQSAAHAA